MVNSLENSLINFVNLDQGSIFLTYRDINALLLTNRKVYSRIHDRLILEVNHIAEVIKEKTSINGLLHLSVESVVVIKSSGSFVKYSCALKLHRTNFVFVYPLLASLKINISRPTTTGETLQYKCSYSIAEKAKEKNQIVAAEFKTFIFKSNSFRGGYGFKIPASFYHA